MPAKKPTYTEAQIAAAVEIVNRSGGLTVDAVRQVRAALGNPELSKTTIWRWLQADVTGKKVVTEEAREQAAKALDEMFEAVARNYLEHATKPEVIADLDGKAAVTAAAIAVDKMRLLRDLPTEIVSVLPGLMDAIKKSGMSASDVFQSMIDELSAISAAKRIDE